MAVILRLSVWAPSVQMVSSFLSLIHIFLAADSLEENTGFADTRAYEWLEAYAAEYGFILRRCV